MQTPSPCSCLTCRCIRTGIAPPPKMRRIGDPPMPRIEFHVYGGDLDASDGDGGLSEGVGVDTADTDATGEVDETDKAIVTTSPAEAPGPTIQHVCIERPTENELVVRVTGPLRVGTKLTVKID